MSARCLKRHHYASEIKNFVQVRIVAFERARDMEAWVLAGPPRGRYSLYSNQCTAKERREAIARLHEREGIA